MTIERMAHVVALASGGGRQAVLDWLYERRELHVASFADTPPEWEERFRPLSADAAQLESQVSRLQTVADFLRPRAGVRGDFLSSIFPVKTLATRREVADAAASTGWAELYETCLDLSAGLEAAAQRRERLKAEADRLEQWRFLDTAVGALRSLRHVSLRLVVATESSLAFAGDERVREHVFVFVASESKAGKVYALAASPSHAELVRAVISQYALRELALPETDLTVAGRLAGLADELAEVSREEMELEERAAKLAGLSASSELALAQRTSEAARVREQAMMAASDSVFAARGYVRLGRLERLRKDLESAFPAAALVECPPPDGEQPPVSLRWSRFVRPAGLLVRMFGLPRYDSFDPTPFLMFTFLAFFGMCFGDLLYGAMLIGAAALLKRRFAGQRNLVEFFRLFSYAGVSTMIFGVLTGSWGSDITSYFGDGNSLDVLRLRLTLLDPLQKPMVALGIAVGLGVVNQFYGLVLRFLNDVWRGDAMSGFYDGVLWLAYLGSLLALAFAGAGVLPAAVTRVALVIFAASALGLVLTQGRNEKSWAARLLTGTVSLYGILGTYGTTSFIGDVLSYSRLLALGLTTSVIGMAFNIIAGFLKQVPVAGLALFVLIAIFGHSFNFLMSILGSFVHPARLIFLEFFGRFYQSGGAPFRPFGFHSEAVELVEGA